MTEKESILHYLLKNIHYWIVMTILELVLMYACVFHFILGDKACRPQGPKGSLSRRRELAFLDTGPGAV